MDESLSIPNEWIIPTAMALVAATLILFAVRLLGVMKSSPQSTTGDTALRLSVEGLPFRDLPPGSPCLEVIHVAAQLPLLVIAPLGKNRQLPSMEVLPQMLDRAIPGLREVLEVHQTKVIVWPAQMSSSGFRERFFQQVNFPGERGKGTEWVAAAGCFSTAGQRFALGLAIRSDEPNNLGHLTIEQDAQWLDQIRVRRS